MAEAQARNYSVSSTVCQRQIVHYCSILAANQQLPGMFEVLLTAFFGSIDPDAWVRSQCEEAVEIARMTDGTEIRSTPLPEQAGSKPSAWVQIGGSLVALPVQDYRTLVFTTGGDGEVWLMALRTTPPSTDTTLIITRVPYDTEGLLGSSIPELIGLGFEITSDDVDCNSPAQIWIPQVVGLMYSAVMAAFFDDLKVHPTSEGWWFNGRDSEGQDRWEALMVTTPGLMIRLHFPPNWRPATSRSRANARKKPQTAPMTRLSSAMSCFELGEPACLNQIDGLEILRPDWDRNKELE